MLCARRIAPSVPIRVMLTALFLGLLAVSPAYAMDYHWIGGSGDWSDPLNWNPGVPSGSDPMIYLTQSDAVNRTVNLTGASHVKGVLVVDATGTGTMTLSGGGGLIVNDIRIGLNGTGTVNQTGGDVVAGLALGPGSLTLGQNAGSRGTYNLSGGTTTTQTLTVGGQGTGVFNQTGGDVLVQDAGLRVGPLGTYNLSGTGTLTMNMAVLGGERIEGTFNQSGGVNSLFTTPLKISGTYNLSGGELSSKMFPASRNNNTGAVVENGGTFNQSGGNFGMAYLRVSDNGRVNLSNGTLQAWEVLNNGTLTYSGGKLQILPVPGNPGTLVNALTNNGTTVLTGNGTRTVDGNVVNNGTFKTTQTTAVYTGTFTNNGAYISKHATQYFNDIVIGGTGYLVGQHSDKFYVSGDFTNQSTMNTAWNTSHSYLGFVDGVDLIHSLDLAGQDLGSAMSGYSDNFSWGTLDLTGEDLYLFDGNDTAGGALYVRDILGLEISDHLISNVFGIDGLNVYYMANLKENDYLGGLLYDLSGGGHLVPVGGNTSVPEPTTLLCLGLGLIGLMGLEKKLGIRERCAF